MEMRFKDWEPLLYSRLTPLKTITYVLNKIGLLHIAQQFKTGVFEVRNALGLQNLIRLSRSDKICHDLHYILSNSETIINELKSLPAKTKILFPHMRGSYFLELFEIFLAHRLRYEGYQPLFLACGGLPICNNYILGQYRSSHKWICKDCYRRQVQLLKTSKLQFITIPELNTLSKSIRKVLIQTKNLSVNECYDTSYHEVPIGRLIEPSVARHLRKSALRAESTEEIRVWRKYLASAFLLVENFNNAINIIKPEIAILPGGLFFWYSIALHMMRKNGIRVLCYETAFHYPPKGKLWMFAKNTSFIDPDWLSSAWQRWINKPLTFEENNRLDQGLQRRRSGSLCYPSPIEEQQQIRKELGFVDNKKPIVTLFTNVTWDAAVFGRSDAPFNDVSEWVIETIRCLANQEISLVVRIHPAEAIIHEGVYGRENLSSLLQEALGSLPKKIRIIPPESKISSYSLLDLSNVAVFFASTLGLEAMIKGTIPVIIAGSSRYGHKGFGYCPKSKKEYINFLTHIDTLKPPSLQEKELARRFAYLYFFRIAWPIQFFNSGARGIYSIDKFFINSLKDISPGKNKYLDVLVKAIKENKELVLPQELSDHLL